MNSKWLSIILFISAPLSATEIYDFKSGLVCPANDNKKWICHETQDVFITGQGRCKYNEKPFHCTWYGFSFRYRNNTPGAKLVCEVSQSDLANYGNPKEVTSINSNSTKYEIPLDNESGYFMNPQYSIFKAHKPEFSLVSESTVCSINNKHAAEFSFNFHYPKVN